MTQNQNQVKNYLYYKPEFDLERAKFENFLRTFEDKTMEPSNIHGNRKYMVALVN